ncbi:hypothetical protein FHW58_002309 [Duganella sp. 1224]|uniref:PEP-CTERM sorting domain-containing protein n=1 Tax=Duganella sp. 1224 TaxID=2587052 RepID=UPI001834CC4C|nr:PEP-CTERM sorting domain-containing protein [Duganella sp. 1224]NYE61157.1 hypothetical protein [Duganella sp. 1224]
MKTAIKAALFSILLVATAAHAKPGGGNNNNNNQGSNPGPGHSGAGDVTLSSQPSSAFALVQGQQINPVQSNAGFATQFATPSQTPANGWTLAGTVEKDNGMAFSDKVVGDGLSFSLSKATGSDVNGTWSVSNSSSKNTTLDLVLSFHAGNNVGSFLFNDLTINAGQTMNGTWLIQWLNNANSANSVPAFSNVAFYTGSFSQTAAVPEPSTYAMLLGGLALMGYVARRRKA